MAAVDKEDITRIHNRIDKLEEKTFTKLDEQTNGIGLINITLAKLCVKMDTVPKPQERPCKELSEHLDSHKNDIRTWKKSVINLLAGLVKVGIVALVGYWLASVT